MVAKKAKMPKIKVIGKTLVKQVKTYENCQKKAKIHDCERKTR